MSTKGYVPRSKYIRGKDEVPMFLDGDKDMLLQATIVVGAKPICFTSTGMVVYFNVDTFEKRFRQFKTVYYYDPQWRKDQWEIAKTIHKKYEDWIKYLHIVRRIRHRWLTQSSTGPLSCPDQSSHHNLELE